jgi:hypothetical protein
VAPRRGPDEVSADIISALEIRAEYVALGVKMARSQPRASGKIPCFAADRDDRNPSAYVDTKTGRYGDSKTGESFSLWEFAYRQGRFKDWQEARRYYADKAGVRITGKKDEDWRTKLEFYPWDQSNSVPAQVWCKKRHFAWGAAKAAGARFVRWPCWVDKDTGEKKPGKFKCIAFPCYDHRLIDADPVAWVLMNLFGDKLELYRGKGQPPDMVTKISVGPTFGTLMNPFALMRMRQSPSEVEVIWKTAGPTDMLALMSRLPADKITAHLVTTNASGESGDVPDEIAGVFTGHRVFICHDADTTGEIGASKWLKALAPVAREVRQVRLPFESVDKKGKDLRDFADGYTDDDDVLRAPMVDSGIVPALCN